MLDRAQSWAPSWPTDSMPPESVRDDADPCASRRAILRRRPRTACRYEQPSALAGRARTSVSAGVRHRLVVDVDAPLGRAADVARMLRNGSRKVADHEHRPAVAGRAALIVETVGAGRRGRLGGSWSSARAARAQRRAGRDLKSAASRERFLTLPRSPRWRFSCCVPTLLRRHADGVCAAAAAPRRPRRSTSRSA